MRSPLLSFLEVVYDRKRNSKSGESKIAGFFSCWQREREREKDPQSCIAFWSNEATAVRKIGYLWLLCGGFLSVWLLIIGPKMLFSNVFEIELLFFLYVFKCFRVDFPSLNNSPENHCNCFIILSDLQCTEWIVYMACGVPNTSRRKTLRICVIL